MNMQNPLFIHIGTHKSGTTAIQKTLDQIKNQLKKEGIIYLPRFPEEQHMLSLSSLDSGYIDRCRNYYASIFKRYRNKKYKFVISNECLSGDFRACYENTPIVAAALRQIFEGMDAKLVVFLRRQSTFIESLYVQTIQEGGFWSFDEYFKTLNLDGFNWARFLECFEKHFGVSNIIVKRYGKEFITQKNGIIDEFADSIGSRYMKECSFVSNYNLSYSREAIEFARICNKHFSGEEKVLLRKVLQASSVKSPFEKYPFFTNEQRKQIYARFRESNRQVLSIFLGIRTGDLFPEPDVSAPDKAYKGLDTEATFAVLARMILRVRRDYPSRSVLFDKILMFEDFLRKHFNIGSRKPYNWY